MNKEYKLSYLPVFEEDMQEAVYYIAKGLHNPTAAKRLLDDTEQAILERLKAPESFQPYALLKKRDHPYYRINIRNFSVFYVVIGDVMEVRRSIYSKRDIDAII